MKYFILQLHKWLGIISGLVVFIVSITGAIFTFQDEIKDLLFDYRKIEVQGKPQLIPSEIATIATKTYPNMQLSRIMYMGNDRPVTVMMAKEKEYYMAYVNPYSGKILHMENFKDDFFIVIQYLHTSLLLGAVGKQIVAISTVVFIILLFSGLVLWWPTKKSQRKHAFKVKWNAKWKRLNYDLHNIFGFYACIFALILALTGLSFSYPGLKSSYYKIANLGKTIPKEQKKNIIEEKQGTLTTYNSLDLAYRYAQQNSANAAMFWIYLPQPDKNPLSIRAYHKSLRYYAMDFYQFGLENGLNPQVLKYEKLSSGKKLTNAMYDIHTGMILGILGKIIAFLISLVCASLPITGVLVWINKGKKGKKKGKN